MWIDKGKINTLKTFIRQPLPKPIKMPTYFCNLLLSGLICSINPFQIFIYIYIKISTMINPYAETKLYSLVIEAHGRLVWLGSFSELSEWESNPRPLYDDYDDNNIHKSLKSRTALKYTNADRNMWLQKLYSAQHFQISFAPHFCRCTYCWNFTTVASARTSATSKVLKCLWI